MHIFAFRHCLRPGAPLCTYFSLASSLLFMLLFRLVASYDKQGGTEVVFLCRYHTALSVSLLAIKPLLLELPQFTLFFF